MASQITFTHDVPNGAMSTGIVTIQVEVATLDALLGTTVAGAKSGDQSSLDVAVNMLKLYGDAAAVEREAQRLESGAQTLRNVPGRGNENAPGPPDDPGPPE